VCGASAAASEEDEDAGAEGAWSATLRWVAEFDHASHGSAHYAAEAEAVPVRGAPSAGVLPEGAHAGSLAWLRTTPGVLVAYDAPYAHATTRAHVTPAARGSAGAHSHVLVAAYRDGAERVHVAAAGRVEDVLAGRAAGGVRWLAGDGMFGFDAGGDNRLLWRMDAPGGGGFSAGAVAELDEDDVMRKLAVFFTPAADKEEQQAPLRAAAAAGAAAWLIYELRSGAAQGHRGRWR
jgi:hypothetical protein